MEAPTAEWEHIVEPEDRFWLWHEVRMSPLQPFRVNVEVSIATYRRAQSEGYDTPEITIPLDPHWWLTKLAGHVWVTRGGCITRYGETP